MHRTASPLATCMAEDFTVSGNPFYRFFGALRTQRVALAGCLPIVLK